MEIFRQQLEDHKRNQIELDQKRTKSENDNHNLLQELELAKRAKDRLEAKVTLFYFTKNHLNDRIVKPLHKLLKTRKTPN